MNASDRVNGQLGFQVQIRFHHTPGYWVQLAKPGNEAKKTAFAMSRADLSTLPLPQFVRGVNLPTFGIVRNGLDAFVVDGNDGLPIRGETEMRDAQGIPPACDLVSVVAKREHLNPIMWSGLGNPTQNLGCLAWTSDGKLTCSVREGERLASRSAYPSLVLWKDGRVDICDVTFVPSGIEDQWNPLINGSNQREALHFVISGQLLLFDGKPIDPNLSLQAASAYADIRHLIVSAFPHLIDQKSSQPAFDKDGKPIKRDFALNQLVSEPPRLEAAITGRIVELGFDMVDVDGTLYTVLAPELERALQEKGYQKTASVAELRAHESAKHRGHYWIDEESRRLQIIYAKTSYPHHFAAVRKDEPHVLYEGFVGGWSNNAGTNPADLAVDLAEAGFTAAVLLDNGGDVALVYRWDKKLDRWADPNGPCAVIPSSLSRKQWAALLLYHVRSQTDESAIQIKVCPDGVDCGGHTEFRVVF